MEEMSDTKLQIALTKRHRGKIKRNYTKGIKKTTLPDEPPSNLHAEWAIMPTTRAVKFQQCWTHRTDRSLEHSLTALTKPRLPGLQLQPSKYTDDILPVFGFSHCSSS